MKKKALLASILTIAMCFSVIAGATFALFTSESTVNVAVTSGTVDVDATILEDTLATSSLGVAQANGAFENGGNAAFDANAVLVLTNMTPGDAVSFSIESKNNSNVNVQYRVKWAVDGKLYEALVATADDTPIVNNTSAWELWTAPATDAEKVKTVEVELTLPTEVDNEYQNQTAAIAFTVEAVQGNAIVSNVASFEQLNLALAYGNTATLVEDITLGDGESINVPAGTTGVIDLNGKSITASGSEPAINNEGTLSIVNGAASTLSAASTISVSEVNGRAAILNSGDLTLKDVTVIGAPLGQTEYPEYAIRTSGNLTIEEGTSVLSDRGCVRTDDGASVVINGGEFIVSDAANTLGRNLTLHTVYAYGDTAAVTIYGGHFEMNYATTAGASVVCPAGAAVTINGGDFRDPLDNVDGSGDNWKNTHNILIYMGYNAPIVVNGGTFDDYTVTHSSITIAKYHEVVYNAQTGLYTIELKDDVLVTDNAADVSNALGNTASGEAATVILGGDVSISTDIKNDATIELGGNTLTMTSSDQKVSGNLNVIGGEVNVTNGYFDFRPTESDKAAVFEGVDFVNTKKEKTWGNSTDRVESAVEFCPPDAGLTAKVIFRDCNFYNSNVIFEAMSGKDGTVEVLIERCPFTNFGNSSDIEVSIYLTIDISIKDCTFYMTAPSNVRIIDAMSSSTVTVNFEGNNVVNGEAATPTNDPALVGAPDEIKVFTSQSVKVAGVSVDTVNGLDTVTVNGIATK